MKGGKITKKTNYKIVDNFFPLDVFNELYEALLPPPSKLIEVKPQLCWGYTPSVKNTTNKGKEDLKLFYLTHLIYEHTILSPLYNKIIPHCKPFDIKSLIRIKINMYPNTEILKEHGMHIDYDFPHKAGILSINTCDGYTKLEDGTKIDSVANRMLLFDASTPHTSSTCTDQPVRVNINFNYF
jgi:hypothetical protein